jgi:hypothetical protein
MNTLTTTSNPVNIVPMTPRRWSPRKVARTAGVFYLVIFTFGLFAELYVRGTLVDPASAAATAANITDSEGLFRLGFVADTVMVLSDVAVAVLVYVLLRPVSRTLSMLAAAFRLTQAAVLGSVLLAQFAALIVLDPDGPGAGLSTDDRDAMVGLTMEAHSYGYLIGLVFFAAHLLVLAYLMIRSSWFPSWLGVILGIAGVGYAADSFGFFILPGYDGTLSPVLLAPAVIAEFSMIAWLLVKGVRVDAWRRDVDGAETSTGVTA